MTLDEITAEIRNRVAANGGIAGKIVKFHFGDEGVIRIDATAGEVVVDNADSAADCTVKISKSDFLDMAAGKLNPTAAFMSGKIKIDGDMGLAMQLGKILN
ncbi:SCP2 sterol-binding domain-containing protein [Brevundimonas sp. R86498]|uniref:SCP2 sterol-binding domain-containing protein n=1 Tax=Brevundimonas sp. R86498 TaxID=3093845 RepID=UPI0037CB3404